MKKLIIFGLIFGLLPFLAESRSFSNSNSWRLAQNNLNNAFDPFIDYGEFQDNVAELESINFFQKGRILSLALFGGYEALSLNIRQIYGDAPLLGANINFFLDLHLALQVYGAFPTGHYNSLVNSNSLFSHYGVNFKYYLNRQYLTEELDPFNPYIVFGPFLFNTQIQLEQKAPEPQTPANPEENIPRSTSDSNTISEQELKALPSFNSAGVKLGIGIEFPFINQSFIGFEAAYLYTVLMHENEDLATLDLPPVPQPNRAQNILERLLFPNRPEVRNYRFHGDLMNFIVLFGVNF